MNDQNPRISLNGTVSTLELKPGYWVQCNMRTKYNSKTCSHDKYVVVELMVDEKTEEFIIRCPKQGVKIEHWEER